MKNPLLTPQALLLSAFYLFYFALVGVYVIFMPKALVDLGYDAYEVGVIYAAAPFMRFLLPFIFKHFIPLNSRIYAAALVMTLTGTLLFHLSIERFWLYLGANLLFGGAMGVTLPFVETIALSTLSKSHYGKVRLWGSLGFMGIALWLGKVLQSPYDTLHYLSVTTFFTMLFGLALIRYDRTEHALQESDDSFSLRRYWAFWVSVFLMQVGFGGFYNFFTIYETAHGVSLEVTSWMWSFGVICEVAMLYFQGPLLQKNLLKILQFATLVTAGRWMMLYLFPDSIPLTFASQSLHAISFALYHTAAITYVFSLYSQKKLAQQFFLGIAFGLGGSVGAVLSGRSYGEYLFFIESLITFVAFAVLLLHEKRKEARR